MDWRSYFEWCVAKRIGGVRMFLGNLTWQGQLAATVRLAFPEIVRVAHEYGLAVMGATLTDTGSGQAFDERTHVRAYVDAVEAAGSLDDINVANEFWHPSQNDRVHKRENLVEWATAANPLFPWSVGAAEIDELEKPADQGGQYPGWGGTDNETHPRRLYHPLVQFGRIRELDEFSRAHATTGTCGEPVGWDRLRTQRVLDGSRMDDPVAFWLLGIVCALMECRLVGHGQHCLRSEMPDLNEDACAQAMSDGYFLIVDRLPTDRRLVFKNGHWGDSPFTGRFYSGAEEGELKEWQPYRDEGNKLARDRVWRIHSGLVGDWGMACASGVLGDPGFVAQGGWSRRLIETRAFREGGEVQVYEVAR